MALIRADYRDTVSSLSDYHNLALGRGRVRVGYGMAGYGSVWCGRVRCSRVG